MSKEQDKKYNDLAIKMEEELHTIFENYMKNKIPEFMVRVPEFVVRENSEGDDALKEVFTRIYFNFSKKALFYFVCLLRTCDKKYLKTAKLLIRDKKKIIKNDLKLITKVLK